MRRPPLATCLGILGALALLGPLAPIARSAGTAGADRVASSVFFVAKSENRNQVHYGVALDANCAPAGTSPVFAYWRMHERGPLATEPLLDREVPAYGVAWQHVVDRGDRGGRVVLGLNALPGRAIAIDSEVDPTPDRTGCTATARAMIDGTAASLTSVFVQLRWPFGVDYLLLSGRAATDGRPVQERLAR
jgi:hypothetical protein